ncbi:MAG TPA: hypothetical protein VM009_03165 [Terriglobales bacterium]|nr:hypothetical protein [Terriglobales bacterium]
MPRLQALCLSVAVLALSASLFAQSDISANELVRRMVDNELAAAAHPAHWMYLSRKEEGGKIRVRQIIQSKEVILERLVAVNDATLTSAERAKEDRRIAKLVGDTGALDKLKREQQEDKVKAQKMLELLPRAFLYEYAGREDDLIKLTFKPNPAFKPPSREARVFHAMEGEMWVHEDQRRLAKMAGRLTDDVNFGFGLLGHLDKGGRFQVEQSEVSPRIWEMTSMEVNMRGRALIFATIKTQEREEMSHFDRVPDELTAARAVDLLMRTEHLARKN